MARSKQIGLTYFPFDVDFFENEKIEALSGEFGIKGELAVIKLFCAIYKNGYYLEWNDLQKMKLLKRLPGVSSSLLDQIIKKLVKWELLNQDIFTQHSVMTSKNIQKQFINSTKRRKDNSINEYDLINVYINDTSTNINVNINTTSSGQSVNKSTQSKVKESKVNTSSNEEVKKNTQKKDLGCVFENLNEEEISNSQTSKNLEEEKEKNCEKKEKELSEGFTTELRNSQFFKNVCEFFSQKSESLQMKVIGRMISIAREKDFEEFRKQTKAYMGYKNQTGEKVHRFQNFSFDWDQDDWIDKLKKLNQTKNGKSESPSPNKAGRVNVDKAGEFLERRRKERELQSAQRT